jgi:predicted metalloendopeptidase
MKTLRKSSLVFVIFATTVCSAKQSPQNSGIDLVGMDKSVAPGDDFNAYTNGGWIKATPIPADSSSYGLDHAPEQYRAVRNLDGWYDAFSMQASHKLFLAQDKRVRVWQTGLRFHRRAD